MDYRQEYDKWCNDPYFDDQTREELKAIAGDDKEIEDRFYRTPVSYTHLRAHETDSYLVCRLLLEKKKKFIHCRDSDL